MFTFLLPLLTASIQDTRTVYIDQLDLSGVTQDWGKPGAAKSVDGAPLTVAKHSYSHGLGTHANGLMTVLLKGNAVSFSSFVGVDDETKGRGSVRFEVWVDGKMTADSGVLKAGDEPKRLEVSLQGAHKLELISNDGDDGIDYDHADWGDAEIIVKAKGPLPKALGPVPAAPPMPIYMAQDEKPEINGARVVGCTPGLPFLFKVPASGRGPLTYTVDALPPGLVLDTSHGILSGTIGASGDYSLIVTVAGPKGRVSRALEIRCGDHLLAQTPPMGWNSWNVWGMSVTANKVRAAADSFVKEGLMDFGYRFVNIDDGWEAGRSATGEVQTTDLFGDMAALASYVHSKGLMLGIYSSPGPKTCGGHEGSYQHEQQDADTYAKWGIDYLKYDWCSYGNIAPKEPSLEDLQAPYVKMRTALDSCGRDIVFSLCQYGMGDVFKWGKSVGGNLWRTTGDINDSWSSLSSIAFAHSEKAFGASPGGWNDPDMLVVGRLGWSDNPQPTHLTPNEQITHITMWSLLAAPLMLGCDLTRLDRFTKALITNHDVLDVNQDPMGKAATRRFSTPEGAEVWARPLWDGTLAVGLMNRSREPMKITARWSDLGLSGSQPVRDLWMRQGIGSRKSELTETVPAHGARLFRIGKMKP